MGGVTAGAVFTWKFTLHHLEVVSQTLPIIGLPLALEGAKLVQLSDLHVRPLRKSQFLAITITDSDGASRKSRMTS